MPVDRFFQEFSRIITMSDAVARTRELASFLESNGYLYGARSAENILLLQSLFPIETLHRAVLSSLSTPSPDMALNAFERLAGVIPPVAMAEVAQRKNSLGQFLQLCGS